MNALILMTRVPIPGTTKTRLSNFITHEKCAELHMCFLMDLFNTFNKLYENFDIYLTYTPSEKFYLIEDIMPKYISHFPQEGESLGERMKNAIDNVFKKGYKKVILIGSDIPHLTSEDIMKSFDKLDDSDICIGPTFDGGYYLIGMKKIYNEIFENNIKWGNKSVLEGTIDLANILKLDVELCSKYLDIDTKDDLLYFKNKIINDYNNIEGPKNTINFINNYWSEFINESRNVIG